MLQRGNERRGEGGDQLASPGQIFGGNWHINFRYVLRDKSHAVVESSARTPPVREFLSARFEIPFTRARTPPASPPPEHARSHSPPHPGSRVV